MIRANFERQNLQMELKPDKISKKRKYLSEISGIEINLYSIVKKSFERESYCDQCKRQCDHSSTHLYGCFEALRWGNKYIYYCPLGFQFSTVICSHDPESEYDAVVAGPMLVGNPEDYDESDGVQTVSASQVNALCEIMHTVFVGESEIRSGKDLDEYAQFLNSIYKNIDKKNDQHYPMEIENELLDAVKKCNVVVAKELLNDLMGRIFFQSGADFSKIKSSVAELVILISRAAIEGGADPDRIFAFKENYINSIDSFENVDEICVWLGRVLQRFIGYVFEFTDVKHSDTIYKITAYVGENYMNKITLDDIAAHVYLSKSYVSKVFKEEIKYSLTDYINRVRVDKSKELFADPRLSLAEIAYLVGFDDQSYFTKIFKKNVGVSPGKFREKFGAK